MPNTAAPVVVIAPDSFKGSLSAEQVAHAIATGVRRVWHAADIRMRPLADGGEGTLDALLTRGGRRVRVHVRNAAGEPFEAASGVLDDRTSIVESAEIVGLTDAAGMRVPIERRSTLGLGDAIRAHLDQGARRILIALGGSSTNDGGAGLLSALGMRLLDEDGVPLPPTPDSLDRLAGIDASGIDARLRQCELVAMTDVDNPLCGPHGATAMFGPQKGAKPAQIATLDRTLSHFADLVEAALGKRVRDLPGAGAAGGLGFALHALGATFEPGAEIVAAEVGLDAALEGADWLITGEGRSDEQTLRGKTPFVACSHARKAGIPATLLSGGIVPDALPALGAHFSGCFSPIPGPMTLDAAIAGAETLLADGAEQLARLFDAARGVARLETRA
ncbi:glycerate kinase [Pararobbsia silviterrae]|uniref:Glycerate kinase n=1 Tax=Pararobbsia silviterrae TaxID=1792498 RepID=A0A494XY99_9BURK|nr:glycerate kinase [Pararobbsia silviterrae]RKP54734.1 glycerate kinase [Pararobbsia silviterrae]